MSARQLLTLCLLASFWGASFLFMRLSVDAFGVLPLTALRSAVAALTLSPLLLMKGQWAAFRRHWGHIAVVGILASALPFTFLALSTQHTSAGFASIMNSLTPIFSALVAWLWLKETLDLPGVLGIGLSFGGVLVMMGDGATLGGTLPVLPVLAGVSATVFYGLAGNYSRRFLRDAPPVAVAAGCQIFATLALLPAALWLWPSLQPSALAWGSAATLGVVCTGLAFILYFHLLASVGVARTVIVTYLVPVFAMLWGWFFLGEVVTPHMLAGAACILTGIGLTTGLLRQWARARTAG